MPSDYQPPDQLLDTKWVANVTDRGPEGNAGVVIQANPQFVSTVAQRLQPYKNFPNQYRPALEKVGDYVRTVMIPRTFEKEGPGWRPLAKRTQRERRAQGFGPQHPILVRTGDLFKELTEQGHPGHIEIIKTGKFARIEIGGSSEKFLRNQGGNFELRIPPRPMIPGTGNLPLPQEDKDKIKTIIADSVRSQMKRQ